MLALLSTFICFSRMNSTTRSIYPTRLYSMINSACTLSLRKLHPMFLCVGLSKMVNLSLYVNLNTLITFTTTHPIVAFMSFTTSIALRINRPTPLFIMILLSVKWPWLSTLIVRRLMYYSLAKTRTLSRVIIRFKTIVATFWHPFTCCLFLWCSTT